EAFFFATFFFATFFTAAFFLGDFVDVFRLIARPAFFLAATSLVILAVLILRFRAPSPHGRPI
ncbi:MAG: hypothetical protein ACI8W3_003824, partial [Myxococcota bacterium]